MPKTSKFERENILSKIRECKALGLNQVETANRLGKSKSCIATYCSRYKITGWPQGAAAHDQRGNKNPAFIDGLSRATVNRRSKEALIKAGRNLFICEKCGDKRDIELPRHHINRDRSNNTPDNLWVLCVSCHNREHIGERSRDSFGRLKSATL